ncbi:hypothetical protein TELCIR_16185 [Teladorsagia circumcincta]|uniref:Uncharacterized protein n=1 Tax=Teladorsagia circumcincta TaxID=45464 RepID=A0A2G9TWG7_TELCI|nr:hypothetical protein TELCIR_16185 [Teladorsagia circumcincta]
MVKIKTMFKALRRLHGQNLESRGLNDMTEAFQSFVTRARFFSVGKLRWVAMQKGIALPNHSKLLAAKLTCRIPAAYLLNAPRMLT